MIIKMFSLANYHAMMRTSTLQTSWLDDLENFWKSWNLRIFVLFSFFLQAFLIIGGAFRKQRTSRALIGLIWLAYVLADWAAYYALGLISNSTSYCTTTKHGNLHGFWAPFLLLHLGGPSTITAFSLDDTSMWVRSILNIVFQSLVALIAFVEILPDNQLWIASVLIFLAAIIRYSDRVISLYIASTNKSDVRATLKKGTGDVRGAAANPPRRTSSSLETVKENEEQSAATWGGISGDVQMGKDAYGFFEMYKGLYGDLFYIFTDEEWAESNAFFRRLDAGRAFTLMEIQLSLAYEVFYTKIALIQRWMERILYPFSTTCVIAAFVLWIVTDKDEYNTIDIVITYILLIGALLVDVISAFFILISDWMITFLVTSNQARYFTHLAKALITLRKRRWATRFKKARKEQPYFWSSMFSKIFFPHWSESILQLNLVDYCLNNRGRVNQTLLMKYYRIIGYPTDANLYEVEFTAELRDFIFREIQERGESQLALGKVDSLCSGRARWTLKKYYGSDSMGHESSVLNPFAEAFNGLQYDERLLVLHIATEICFRASPIQIVGSSSNQSNQQNKDTDWRCFSKVLSDYMFYLLVLQQDMIFVPGSLWQTLFPDTCEEFKRIAEEITKKNNNSKVGKKAKFDEEACEKFMEVGCESDNKVVSRACKLAMNVRHYEERRWEIMSKVWMELSCHAAIHSRGSAHGAQLSRGGELFTFVWLMLAHFKLGKQFKYRDDDEDDDRDLIKAPVPESPSTTEGEDNWQFEAS